MAETDIWLLFSGLVALEARQALLFEEKTSHPELSELTTAKEEKIELTVPRKNLLAMIKQEDAVEICQ